MDSRTTTVGALAAMVDGKVQGDTTLPIKGLAPLESAACDEISFVANVKKSDQLHSTGAGAVLVPEKIRWSGEKTVILVKDPYLASAIIHSFFLQEPFVAHGVHPRAQVGSNCHLGQEITVAPLAVIGDRVQLGERVRIASGVVIGDDVCIGDDTTIHANVSIYDGCIIGSKVIVHAGTVIGSDGYGYATNERGEHYKRPQVGIVRIEDDVEIGANCCIDRATFGETVIRAGAKIDNMVQIAHNVEVGNNSLLVAQVGIAGSTVLGRNVVLGGQVGVAGHITLGDQVMVAACAGVHNDLKPGARVGGAPAFDVRDWAKSCAVFAKLPELQRAVRNNSKAITRLDQVVEQEQQGED